MPTANLRVVLAMEASLLTSAIAQCLADNPRLTVDVQPPGGAAITPAAAATGGARTVRVGLLDDPVRFALHTDGRDWIVEYQTLADLAGLLADLAHAELDPADLDPADLEPADLEPADLDRADANPVEVEAFDRS